MNRLIHKIWAPQVPSSQDRPAGNAIDRDEASYRSKFLGTYLSDTVQGKAECVFRFLLLAYIIVNTYTFYVGIPAAGLDNSWAFALNHLVNSGLRFGKDVFFTFGPLGFLLNPMNIGNNVPVAALCFLTVWLLFASLLIYGAHRRLFTVNQLFLFAISTIFCYGSGFVWLLSCLIAALLLFQSYARRWPPFFLLAVLLTVPCFFIKFSLAMFAWSAILALSLLQVLQQRERGILMLGMSGILVPVLFAFAYLIYNPSLHDLVQYIRAGYEISSGYSVAMSSVGKWYNIYLAAIFTAAYIYIIIRLYKSGQPTFWHSLAFIVPLFVSFKHGFVRQDGGHLFIFFSTAIMIIGLLLLFSDLRLPKMKGIIYIYPALIFICFFTYHIYFNGFLFDRIFPISSFRSMIKTVTFVSNGNAAGLKPDLLPGSMLAEIGGSRVGIFPWEICYAAANDLNYSPLPVFQTYSAYTSYLDYLDADFLNGNSAPPYLLAAFQALDGRHCLVDVPATWLSIYKWYEPKLLTDSVLLLKRRSVPRFETLKPVGSAVYGKAAVVGLPQYAGPLLVKISLNLSLTGKIVKTLYHIAPVEMALTDCAGGVSVFRVVPETLKDGLFLNYLPMSLNELDMLMNGKAARKFCSFQLFGPGLTMYRDQMSVQFIEIPAVAVDHPPEKLPLSEGILKSSNKAKFNIDSITPVQIGHQAFLFVKGWAVDPEAKDSGGGVWTDIDGKAYLADRYPRRDIAAYFKQPGYKNSGFEVYIPASSLSPGAHKLSLQIIATSRKYYYRTEPITIEIPAR